MQRTFAFYHKCFPFSTSKVGSIKFEHLFRRRILKIHGPETSSYLQGMVTNNMNSFNENAKKHRCIYALLLNAQGRVLYDCLVYKCDENEFLLEHDAAASGFIKVHLEKYRMRKKVRIDSLKNVSVWAAFSSGGSQIEPDVRSLEEQLSAAKNNNVLVSAPDPRLSALGFRFITSGNGDNKEQVSDLSTSYNLLRYKLGIGEGVIDHPPGICLPFETNVDYLNGVSFTKGCYVGQELTARVHHTGVIRKRIMPVTLIPEREDYPNFPVECNVMNSNQHKIGKFRNRIGRHGLATLNVEESLKASSIKLNGFDVHLEVKRPEWWPETQAQ